jgi:hypothetical protein
MNGIPLSYVALGGVVAVGLALSSAVLVRARVLLRRAERRELASLQQWEAKLQAMREELSSLNAQLGELHRQTPVAGVAVALRPGLNLSTRSQALLMHRKGDPPERIASALEVPRQQVDLLIKVHDITSTSL